MEYALINVKTVSSSITPLHHANQNAHPPRNGTPPHNHAKTQLVGVLSITTQILTLARTVQLVATNVPV